ncbi:MAG TPA: hypothetical protein VHH36_08265 [Candidatus Thermoplasmatota archaeon]|nr:hypothetical protein [Candidatus Thermoplasmatota archaeon]
MRPLLALAAAGLALALVPPSAATATASGWASFSAVKPVSSFHVVCDGVGQLSVAYDAPDLVLAVTTGSCGPQTVYVRGAGDAERGWEVYGPPGAPEAAEGAIAPSGWGSYDVDVTFRAGDATIRVVGTLGEFTNVV